MIRIFDKRMNPLNRMLLTCGLALAGYQATFAVDAPKSPVKRTSLERFQLEHLKKTHEDGEKVRAARRELHLPDGWKDVRSIFHSHAEDSEHTGGTRPEMIAEAKKAGVQALFLSDHYRPPRDFVSPERSGMVDGVVLVPGSEMHGFLLHPKKSVMEQMKTGGEPILDAVHATGGMAFLSHVEERQDHSMAKLDGQEIYNRHYDAIVDSKGLMSLVLAMTSKKSIDDFQNKINTYPDETFAFQVNYPKVYLEKWDRELPKKRLSGVAANDCHHNMVLIVKKLDDTAVLVGTNVDKENQMRRIPLALAPGIKELVAGKKPGEVIARVDLDPYHRSFAGSSTHLFAKEVTQDAVREAILKGRAYVSHDWVCNPAGFWIDILNSQGKTIGIIGDELKFEPGRPLQMKITLPAPALVRLIGDGQVVAEQQGKAVVSFPIEKPGVYRVEAFQNLDGEYRGWIYANPVYIRN